jgi:large repetitive protein
LSSATILVSDKRIGKTQRSFETGSGDYKSDEVIRTGLVYKDSTMTYAPNNLTAGGLKTNYSSKWHEEMWTRNPDIGAIISERISSADNLKKETLMQDATMAILGQFEGTADIKAVKGNGPKNETARIEQTFIGNYKLDTTIAINEGPKYLRPHINVTKEVLKQDDYTALFRINLTNDGNKTLGPIYVTDRLPEGLTFINSSLRPDITGREIRWSLPMLQIGGKQSITLRASIKNTGSRFINLVDVSAQYSGGVITARAACGFVLDWLQCCLTERPAVAIKPHENMSPNANYVGGSWVPPKSFNLSLNLSEYPLDQAIPCSSCSSDIPENGGCSTCP